MGTILDYLDWRGDLTFAQSEFNEIDALILCQIMYLKFDGILRNDNFSDSMTLSKLAKKFEESADYDERIDVGMLINEQTYKVLLAAGASERFKDVRITGYISIIDLSKDEQFAAATYSLDPRRHYVVYRGTDDTIVGFKEDFNLAIMDEVPAQKDAVMYLEKAVKNLKGDFYVGGHSKGGNLAVYASAMSKPDVKKRIQLIFNMDGPGFLKKKLQSQEFYEIIPRIRSYYPHFSIVGMIFDQAGEYEVVESEQTGIMQHDPFSWHLQGNKFVLMDDFDEAAVYFNEVLDNWILTLTTEQRSKFIETLFGILQATDARTNSEIESNFLKNSFKIFKAWMDTPADIRDMVEETVRLLFKIAHRQMPSPQEWFSKATKSAKSEKIAKSERGSKSDKSSKSESDSLEEPPSKGRIVKDKAIKESFAKDKPSKEKLPKERGLMGAKSLKGSKSAKMKEDKPLVIKSNGKIAAK